MYIQLTPGVTDLVTYGGQVENGLSVVWRESSRSSERNQAENEGLEGPDFLLFSSQEGTDFYVISQFLIIGTNFPPARLCDELSNVHLPHHCWTQAGQWALPALLPSARTQVRQEKCEFQLLHAWLWPWPGAVLASEELPLDAGYES